MSSSTPVVRGAANRENLKLLMVGQGPILETLKAEEKTLNLEGSVIFTGFRKDVPSIMAAADMLVLPTLWEGLGTVLIEGLLARCALVGTNVGGVPEIILDQRTGLLVAPDGPLLSAKAVDQLIQNNRLRMDLNLTGIEHVHKNFSIQAMVDGVFNVYKNL